MKHVDDKAARTAATVIVEKVLLAHDEGMGGEATAVVSTFPAAEFQTVTKAVQGEVITLRRVILTGPWEVVPTV